MILKGTKIDEAGNLKSNEAIFCKAIPAVSIKKGTKQTLAEWQKIKLPIKTKKMLCKCKGRKIENKIAKGNKILNRLQYIWNHRNKPEKKKFSIKKI